MLAGDFNQTNSTVIYNSIAIHTPAIAINLYSNALLQQLTGTNESYISTVNEPIQLANENELSQHFSIQSAQNIFFMFTINLFYLFGYFIRLPLNERANGFKHIQMMTKLSPVMYWTTNFLWDYFCYIVVIMFTLIIVSIFGHVFTNLHEIIVLLTLFFIFGWSAIIYTYVYSFFKKTHTSAIQLYTLINMPLGFLVYYGLNINIDDLKYTKFYNILTIFRYITLLIPHCSFLVSLRGFFQISGENQIKQLSDSVNSTPKNYFVFKSAENQYGILEETLFLFFSSILYLTIILLLDYKIIDHVYQYLFNAIYGTDIGTKEDDEDSDIIDEKNKVEAAKTRPYDTLSPRLLVDDLVKKFSFQFTGVRGICFTVSPGECFGLLGVNGAGKTTSFRILTGDTFPSKGDAFIWTNKLYKLSSNLNDYVSMIGYCPQFDALNDKLTGKEILKLMAILRGISPTNANKHVNKWIKLLGLDEYKDRICGKYSGGNKRKLNTAMALIGDPPIVFLDEPTSGVDPVSRRNLWNILADCKKIGQAVVLTSHSMDECEALCDRLTIMVDGVMKCIGNIQYLKNRYGQGFTIMIKLSGADNVTVAKLKADVQVQFMPDIHLKDEHKGLLHYHITNPLIPLSKIFGQMEAIKHNYSVIEDYKISDTTLEQVFIAFAKRQVVLNTSSE